jgi:pyruvate/2-oxoglutarate dehydrogenase complex dihydrolipoamide acyltransferase (E2) component
MPTRRVLEDLGKDECDRIASFFRSRAAKVPEERATPEARGQLALKRHLPELRIHVSCDMPMDIIVPVDVLRSLLAEFKVGKDAKRLEWLKDLFADLQELVIYSKDINRALGADFFGVARADRPDGMVIFALVDEVLMMMSRETGRDAFGGSAALWENVLRRFDYFDPIPNVRYLTTPEPQNVLVMDLGETVLVVCFDAQSGKFVEAEEYQPTRMNDDIASLGDVVKPYASLEDVAEAAGVDDVVELGCRVTQVLMSTAPGAVMVVGQLGDTLAAALAAKLKRYPPSRDPEKAVFVIQRKMYASDATLDPKLRDAFAAGDARTPAQAALVKEVIEWLEKESATAPGMASQDMRLGKMLEASLTATAAWAVEHSFDGDVRRSGHDAVHARTFASYGKHPQSQNKAVLKKAAGTLVYMHDGREIHARHDGPPQTVQVVHYEKDDSGLVSGQVSRPFDVDAPEVAASDEAQEEKTDDEAPAPEPDAQPAAKRRSTKEAVDPVHRSTRELTIVEAMVDDEAKEEEEEEEESEEEEAAPAPKRRSAKEAVEPVHRSTREQEIVGGFLVKKSNLYDAETGERSVWDQELGD